MVYDEMNTFLSDLRSGFIEWVVVSINPVNRIEPL